MRQTPKLGAILDKDFFPPKEKKTLYIYFPVYCMLFHMGLYTRIHGCSGNHPPRHAYLITYGDITFSTLYGSFLFLFFFFKETKLAELFGRWRRGSSTPPFFFFVRVCVLSVNIVAKKEKEKKRPTVLKLRFAMLFFFSEGKNLRITGYCWAFRQFRCY